MAGAKGRGRPPRLTTARADALIAALEAGNSLKAASQIADLGFSTAQRYLQRGETAQQAVDTYVQTLSDLRRRVLDRFTDDRLRQHLERRVPEAERVFWGLWGRVTRARAVAESDAIGRIRAAAAGGGEGWKDVIHPKSGEVVRLCFSIPPDWRAEAWFAERHNREDWGRQSQMALTGADGGPVLIEPVEQTRARALAIVDDLRERRKAKAIEEGGEAADG